MPEKYKPGLILPPDTCEGMKHGFDQLVKAIRPTLGPFPRSVVYERSFRNKMPEFLDDGGVIARRIIQLKDRDADVGAMFLRHVLWEVRESAGDGTATAAVLFQAVFEQGLRFITAGGNAMRLNHYLVKGLQLILQELDKMTMPIQGRQSLAQLAQTICQDAELADMMGEILDILGEYGGLEIGEDYGRGVRREYIEGATWPIASTASEYNTGQDMAKKVIDEPAILISDLEIQDPKLLVPILEECVRAGQRKLVLLAGNFSENTIHMVQVINQDPARFQLLAVKTPGGIPDDQVHNMEDIAILTGGKPRIKAAGDTLEGFRSEHLGHARQVWASKEYLGIIHGKGDPMLQRSYLDQLKHAHRSANEKEVRQRLQKRLAKFWNGSANLFVGGINKNETDARKEVAERTLSLLRGALRDGVLPGGGTALLACKSILQTRLSGTSEPEAAAANRILVKALEEPIRTLLTNAGYDDSEILAEIKKSPPGSGFDVISANIVNVVEAGILDVASVVKEAVHAAVSSAGLALTTDVIVLRKNPEESAKP